MTQSDGGLKYLVLQRRRDGNRAPFKDRYLLEYNPHLLVEGMIIGAYASAQAQGYVFLRGEYHEPYRQLQKAIDDCKAKGYLGQNIFGSGFRFRPAHPPQRWTLHLRRRGPALLNALEGQAGAAAHQAAVPPLPAAHGGRPTIVNNVENLLQRALHPAQRRRVVSGARQRGRCGHQALRRFRPA